jgi:hypothetical protein
MAKGVLPALAVTILAAWMCGRCLAQAPPAARTLIFRHSEEPKEKAFSFLVPKDWKVEGGIFRINPMQAGGPGNSIQAKCDIAFKRDDAGTVMLRSLPSINYADFSSPNFANMAGLFRPGSNYQGMRVMRMPTTQEYLDGVFQSVHPKAAEVKVIERVALPELAAVYAKAHQSANDALARVGLPGVRLDAGAAVVEYSDAGVRYKELLYAVLSDSRGSGATWGNVQTVFMRAPAAEADQWKPVLDIILHSIRLNLTWLAGELKGADQRSKIVLDTNQAIAKLNDEIWRSRAKTNDDIHHDHYLTLTDQADYVNPYTGATETDTSDYKNRWVTAGGDVIYTDSADYNPNQDDRLWTADWQRTPGKR